ncbi:hypothetical protein A3715_30880 [Oleiphilus sp. HI0009]|nr:hypothetical protein A3715_19260 [Oleiphilus sp. HI0009]KZX81846.1 hypothetical protein A3715_18815 [Oleiphilus sp. HI0009]KZX83974.1 hypothetical protein A3715_30880 [Oleiphilus sp. HI0009]
MFARLMKAKWAMGSIIFSLIFAKVFSSYEPIFESMEMTEQICVLAGLMIVSLFFVFKMAEERNKKVYGE